MYDVQNLDLTNVVGDTVLVERGKRIVEFFVLDMPIGNSFQVRLGENPKWITISKAFSMEPTADDDANNGVRWRNNVPQAGVRVEIILVFGERLQAVV